MRSEVNLQSCWMQDLLIHSDFFIQIQLEYTLGGAIDLMLGRTMQDGASTTMLFLKD